MQSFAERTGCFARSKHCIANTDESSSTTKKPKALKAQAAAHMTPSAEAFQISHKPEVLLPECFDGSPATFVGFLNQCYCLFSACSQIYPSDRRLMIITLTFSLSGNALSWACPLLERSSPLLDNLDAFIQTTAEMFALLWTKPSEPLKAPSLLQSCSQSSRALLLL